MPKKLELIRPDKDIAHDRITIPAEFWRPGYLTKLEFKEMCETSWITGSALRKLWKMLKRTDSMPDALFVMLRAEDVIREFPPIIKRGET